MRMRTEKREIAYIRFGRIDFLVRDGNADYFQKNIQDRNFGKNLIEVYKFGREKIV